MKSGKSFPSGGCTAAIDSGCHHFFSRNQKSSKSVGFLPGSFIITTQLPCNAVTLHLIKFWLLFKVIIIYISDLSVILSNRAENRSDTSSDFGESAACGCFRVAHSYVLSLLVSDNHFSV